MFRQIAKLNEVPDPNQIARILFAVFVFIKPQKSKKIDHMALFYMLYNLVTCI